MPRSNPVSGGLSRSDPEIRPNSVSWPVRTTRSRAVSLTTLVPRKTQFVRRPSGASDGTIPTEATPLPQTTAKLHVYEHYNYHIIVSYTVLLLFRCLSRRS